METASYLQNFVLFLGPYKWPLFILTGIVLYFIGLKAYHFFILRRPERKNLNAILFWGMVTAALGLIGQVHGIWIALNEIMAAPDISPPMVLIGFLTSFTTTLFGLVVGLTATLAWWGMRYRLGRMESKFETKIKID